MNQYEQYQVRMYSLLREYINATSPENMPKELLGLENLTRDFHVRALMLIAEINNPEGYKKLLDEVKTNNDVTEGE